MEYIAGGIFIFMLVCTMYVIAEIICGTLFKGRVEEMENLIHNELTDLRDENETLYNENRSLKEKVENYKRMFNK